MDDKASIDVGARFTDISKQSYIQGFGATWIFDVDPDGIDTDGAGPDAAGDGVIYTTDHDNGCGQGIQGWRDCSDRSRDNDVVDVIIDCGDVTDPRTRQCGSYGAGFYTNVWQTREIPDAWDTLSPVDLGPMLWEFVELIVMTSITGITTKTSLTRRLPCAIDPQTICPCMPSGPEQPRVVALTFPPQDYQIIKMLFSSRMKRQKTGRSELKEV